MDSLNPVITALHSEGRLRVWSLVITVFGDSVQYRGGRVSTARLRQLLGRIGVESGTLRTALSRLGNDGWVISEREGRNSVYRLSPEGIRNFADATGRIYAAPRRDPVQQWTLQVGGSAGITIAPGVTLLADSTNAPETAKCAVTGQLSTLSDTLRAGLLAEDHRNSLQALANDIRTLQGATLSPLDAAAARTLLIHRWRRTVLRFPDIPAELMPKDAPLENPRAEVANLYHALTPLTEAWLDDDTDGLTAMPAAKTDPATRFSETSGA